MFRSMMSSTYDTFKEMANSESNGHIIRRAAFRPKWTKLMTAVCTSLHASGRVMQETIVQQEKWASHRC